MGKLKIKKSAIAGELINIVRYKDVCFKDGELSREQKELCKTSALNLCRKRCFLRQPPLPSIIKGFIKERFDKLRLHVYRYPGVVVDRSKNCIWCDWKAIGIDESLSWHIRRTHKFPHTDFQAAKTQLKHYRTLLAYVRGGAWWAVAMMAGGCYLCENPKYLADGTKNEKPYRCSRFDTSKNRTWDIFDFNIDLKKCFRDIGVLEGSEWWRYAFILF